MKQIFLLALIALVSACAKPPGSIAPTAVSTANYDGHSCARLANEITMNARELSDAERRQRGAVAADAAGVFLILIPPSAFTGDASADVALNKGEDLALRAAYGERCMG